MFQPYVNPAMHNEDRTEMVSLVWNSAAKKLMYVQSGSLNYVNRTGLASQSSL